MWEVSLKINNTLVGRTELGPRMQKHPWVVSVKVPERKDGTLNVGD